MTEKELKKLNRYQLLELIILQTEQMEALQEELDAARHALEAKQVRLANAGSIAEAAMQLSGIFEAAQSAADIYLEQVKVQNENAAKIEEDARMNAENVLTEAQAQAEQILSDARRQSDNMAESSRKEAETLLTSSREEAEAMLASSRSRSDEILEAASREAASLLEAAKAESGSIRTETESIRAEIEALKLQTLRECEEREQAVTASIQRIREAFQSQFMNLDSLTLPGTNEK